MPRKPKAMPVKKPHAPRKPTRDELEGSLRLQDGMLKEARALMDQMQTEIKQLVSIHNTQLEIIRNLSRKVSDC